MRFGCNLRIIVCYLFRSLNFVNFSDTKEGKHLGFTCIWKIQCKYSLVLLQLLGSYNSKPKIIIRKKSGRMAYHYMDGVNLLRVWFST